MNSEFHTQLYI